jgi:hypothetical protein
LSKAQFFLEVRDGRGADVCDGNGHAIVPSLQYSFRPSAALEHCNNAEERNRNRKRSSR